MILEESREGIPYRGGPRFSLYRHFKKRTMKLNGAGLTKSKARERDVRSGRDFRKINYYPLSLSLTLEFVNTKREQDFRLDFLLTERRETRSV